MQNAEGLEYDVHGEGEPVLLIHGSHVADAFLPLTTEPELADRYQLIRYHRRGFAGSSRHAGPFSIEQQARDALLPVRQLGLERLHIVGHSYGAVTAVQLALDAPHAVHSLTLLEPPLKTAADATAMSEMFAPLLELYRSGDSRGALEAFAGLALGSDWRAEVERTVPGGTEQADKDVSTFFEVEVPALLAWSLDEDAARRISKPALYIIGSESGPLFDGPKQRFLSCVPHTEEAVLPGLNHLLQMRDPCLVAASIAGFLGRHPL
jgi:pimeloyl-ACP methyl ester carboxylesterase